MKNEIEKEYKVLVTEEKFEELCQYYKNLKFIKQTNTYYDSIDHQIQKKKGAMRIRERENVNIFTLKMHTVSGLMEHECVVPIHDNCVFNFPEVKKVLDIYQIKGPFVKINVCTTIRAVVELEYAELCFDKNIFSNNYIDYEIEYEYTQEHDGLTVFHDILKQINIDYTSNCASKIKRAMDSQK